MPVYLERIYDKPQHKGYRVLADRLWPRGLARENAAIDEWCKDVTPSPALRTWYGHDQAKWAEFSKRYAAELKAAPDAANALRARAGKKPIILLTATKDMRHTHIIVLKKFLECPRKNAG